MDIFATPEEGIKLRLKGNCGTKRKSTEGQKELMLQLVDKDPFMSANQIKVSAEGELDNLSESGFSEKW